MEFYNYTTEIVHFRVSAGSIFIITIYLMDKVFCWKGVWQKVKLGAPFYLNPPLPVNAIVVIM